MTNNLRTAIADEISGVSIGSGYYSTTIGIDAALEVADILISANLVMPEYIRERGIRPADGAEIERWVTPWREG